MHNHHESEREIWYLGYYSLVQVLRQDAQIHFFNIFIQIILCTRIIHKTSNRTTFRVIDIHLPCPKKKPTPPYPPFKAGCNLGESTRQWCHTSRCMTSSPRASITFTERIQKEPQLKPHWPQWRGRSKTRTNRTTQDYEDTKRTPHEQPASNPDTAWTLAVCQPNY